MTTTEHEVTCPGCKLVFPVKVLDGSEQEEAEKCNAAYPDSNDTRCRLDPHPDDHDPQHVGRNAYGNKVTWRASDFAK